jgi:hypothetical protein
VRGEVRVVTPKRLRSFVSRVVTVAVALLIIVIGESLGFMRDLDAAISQSRGVYQALAVAILVVGFAGFMGGVVYGAVAGVPSRRLGGPIGLPSADTSPADPQSMDPPTVGSSAPRGRWRRRYVIRRPRQVAGGSFDIQVSFREIKAAWRSEMWFADPWWRFVFYMLTAGIVMIVGIFGVVFVLAPAGIKFLVGGAVLYALVQMVRGLALA